MADNGDSGKPLPDMPPDVLTALAGAHDEAMRALAASRAEVVRLRAALEAIHRIAVICNATQEWVEPRAILRLADLALEQR